MKDWLIEFSKTPVGAIIFIGLYVVVCIFVIFAHTSIGKKALNELRMSRDNVEKDVEEHKESVKKELENTKSDLENEIKALYTEIDELKTWISGALKIIHNKKLQEYLGEIPNVKKE